MIDPLGFGCYRVDVAVPEHHAALKRAMVRGVRLIDTSTNYSFGNSERLVGKVVAEAVAEGLAARDEITVVTKCGYIQGPVYEESQKRKEEGRPWPDLVEYGQGLEHCIHPEFLAGQISQSLERLGMERVEVLLLHNPEYYLGWAERNGMGLKVAREEYYHRIERAFRHLESEVEAGRIGAYGISSNTFPEDANAYQFTSLDTVCRLAEDNGLKNFRVVEMPLNPLETWAVTLANQPGGRSVLDYARDAGLHVLINRPLNAIREGRMVRLAEFISVEPPNPQEITGGLEELAASEDEGSGLIDTLEIHPDLKEQLVSLLPLAGKLREHWDRFGGLEQWRSVAQGYMLPRQNLLMQALHQASDGRGPVWRWVNRHSTTVQNILRKIDSIYVAMAGKQSAEVKKVLAAADPDWAQAATLSQMSIRAIRSTEGVGSVLVGMRDEAYVDDVLAEMARPVEVAPRKESWKRLAEAEIRV